MFWLQDGALDVLVLLDPMLFGVAGQHQGQSTVTGDGALTLMLTGYAEKHGIQENQNIESPIL